jgi:redox-sensitive bicupin YhaK (pirin superfamily)
MAALAPLHGAVHVGGVLVQAEHVARLDRDGANLSLTAATETSVLLLAGVPLGEPIAHYGPFVMNTPGEIDQALLDYAEGRMGRLD